MQVEGHRPRWRLLQSNKKRRRRATADVDMVLMSFMVLTKQTLALAQDDRDEPALLRGTINQR